VNVICFQRDCHASGEKLSLRESARWFSFVIAPERFRPATMECSWKFDARCSGETCESRTPVYEPAHRWAARILSSGFIFARAKVCSTNVSVALSLLTALQFVDGWVYCRTTGHTFLILPMASPDQFGTRRIAAALSGAPAAPTIANLLLALRGPTGTKVFVGCVPITRTTSPASARVEVQLTYSPDLSLIASAES